MGITKTQLERRKKHLGSSDIAAILGLDRFKSAYDVWASKTDRLPDDSGNAATKAGQYFENGVLEYAEENLGNLIRNQYRSVKGSGIPIGTNVDAIVVQTGEPVEAKTAGLFGPLMDHWGNENTDEVPDRVIIQASVHMLCTESELCHIAAFLGGRGFVPFVIRRDETIINVVSETAVNFWEKFVLTDTPPDNSLPSVSTVKRLRREPKSIVQIDDSLVDVWLAAKEAAKAANALKEQTQTEVLAALGDAEAGSCTQGFVTYYEQSRKETIVKASTFRVARFKANK